MTGQFLSVSLAMSLLLNATLCPAQDSFVGKTPLQWSEQLSSSQAQSRIEAAWAIAQIAGRGASPSASSGHAADWTLLATAV